MCELKIYQYRNKSTLQCKAKGHTCILIAVVMHMPCFARSPTPYPNPYAVAPRIFKFPDHVSFISFHKLKSKGRQGSVAPTVQSVKLQNQFKTRFSAD